jgi:hypothetical protein
VSNINIRYLQLALAQLDILLRREVWRWQLAGQNPDDALRGQYISEEEVIGLLERPLATSWGQTVALSTEVQHEVDLTLQQVQARASQFSDEHHDQLRLCQLVQEFDLSPFELNIILLALAPALDLGYERIYGYLQDDVTRRHPTLNLALNLFCQPGAERLLNLDYFLEEAPLLRFRLIDLIPPKPATALAQAFTINGTVLTWLLNGRYEPDQTLRAIRIAPPETIEPTDETEEIDQLLSQQPVLVFWGRDRVRQEEAAKMLAAQAGRALLWVDLPLSLEDGAKALEKVRLALRDARLTGAIPCLVGWDSVLEDGQITPELLAELTAHPDVVIVIGKTKWQAANLERTRHLFWVDFAKPSFVDRRTLFELFLDQEPDGQDLDLDNLAGQFSLTTGQIRDVVASARDTAAQMNRPLQSADLFAAARDHSSSGLAKLARKIEPRYSWDDIILPPDQIAILQELVSTVRARPKVLEGWQVGKKLASSAGVTVLFAGPPGTGKTMAAEVIAGELGLDLYKIDLSTVISKYVGETEKNLEKIFDEAESSNAILFFDEADAIFGKRSEVRDAHDRYANIEISYLLQRMEAYDGITILATNLRANLDEAFIRRLQVAVDFPFPEQPETRLRIWEALFPPTVPRATNVDLSFMASRFKIAGGNIRNIIVNAAYLAAADGGQVTMEHLLHSSRRELQKMGRLVNEADMQFKV